MMKKYLAALSTTALICVAPYALAASSDDLTVTGTITPSACVPGFSDGGSIDLGKISVKDLNPTSVTQISSAPMDLTIDCDVPMFFALNGIDNNPGTAIDSRNFGLGLTDANEKIGSFAPSVRTVEADGKDAGVSFSIDNGATWNVATSMLPGQLTAVRSKVSVAPIIAQNVVMNVLVNTWIAGTDSLTLTNDVTFQGLATFEMKYL